MEDSAGNFPGALGHSNAYISQNKELSEKINRDIEELGGSSRLFVLGGNMIELIKKYFRLEVRPR